MAETPSLLQTGAVLSGTYEVIRLIGRGGMGEVWLARHLRLVGKQVAIKVLRFGGNSIHPEILARFQREAEIASRIGHPNIVEVHDFNTLPNGAPYLVLEYLEGENLAARLSHGPMSLDETKAIIRQVGSALHATHAKGVIHRDLKPDNIFLMQTVTGDVAKVLDFGISKIQDSTTLQTQNTALLGTPQYMAPEQALGHNSEVSVQTDVFALGSIAYEMLSGQPAFSGENIARVVFKVAYEPHLRLKDVAPNVPVEQVNAVEHALQKDRSLRTISVAQFVEEFTGKPITASGVSVIPLVENSSLEEAIANHQPTPSMMFGSTAMAGQSSSTQPKPSSEVNKEDLAALGLMMKARTKWIIGALASVGLLVGVFLFSRSEPPPKVEGVKVLPRPVVVFDAGIPEVKVVEVAKPVVEEPPVAKPKATAHVHKEVVEPKPKEVDRSPTAEEMKTANEVQDAFELHHYQQAIEIGRKGLLGIGAQVTLSRVHGLLAKSYCALKDTKNARLQFKEVDRPMHRVGARIFCLRQGVNPGEGDR